MARQQFDYDVTRDLREGVDLIGTLARDEQSFRAAYQAFRGGDARGFRDVLQRLGIFPRCSLVCEWIRIKECIFLCLDLCGLPKPIDAPPNPRPLAEAVARITADEKLVGQLVTILDKRDGKAFQKIVSDNKLEGLCHAFCHWLCVVRYRLICRWLCSPQLIDRPDLAVELRAAGLALQQLLDNKGAFDAAVAASNAGDAEKLKSAIDGAGLIPFCHYVCEWFCSWRCVFACLTICRALPPKPIEDQVGEALAFARAVQPLAQQSSELDQLITAVANGDQNAWAAELKKLELERFCTQLCGWICAVRCRRFCVLVCPPPTLYPVFTSIGGYDYLTDIHSGLGGNGLTVADSRAFYNTLRLNGILTQTLGGLPMEYRFETVTTDKNGNPTGAWTPVLPGQIAKTEIGHWERLALSPWPPHIETLKYFVNGMAGPTERTAMISADGWIQVPQENNFTSAQGAFFPNGNMIGLISKTLAAFASADETGVLAGGPAAHPLVQDLYFGIRMRVRQHGVPASEVDGGTCVHIAIDDTRYDNVTVHPDWDGGVQPPGQLAVRMVDVTELIAHPCSEITNSLTILFTAAHPNLGSVAISLTGPGPTVNFALPPLPEPGDYYGTAIPPAGWTVSKLKPCAYVITLTVTLLLTDGDSVPDPLYDQIAFCKK
jgi:hypothetical protein